MDRVREHKHHFHIKLFEIYNKNKRKRRTAAARMATGKYHKTQSRPDVPYATLCAELYLHARVRHVWHSHRLREPLRACVDGAGVHTVTHTHPYTHLRADLLCINVTFCANHTVMSRNTNARCFAPSRSSCRPPSICISWPPRVRGRQQIQPPSANVSEYFSVDPLRSRAAKSIA